MLGCRSPKRLLPIAAIACAQALLIAGIAAQNSISDQRPTYPVDGIVLNSLTHQPIPRVLISGMANEVLSSSDGRFELHLPEGETQLRLRRPGYQGQGAFGIPDTFQTVKIVPGMPLLTLYLTPAASITARVELSTGDEPDGIHFTLYQKRVIDGHARWMPSGGASTGSQGVVRFLSLNASVPFVFCSEASRDQPGLAAPGVTVYGYPGACFPGGSDFAAAAASPLILQPGQQAQLDVNLDRQPFYPVSITVPGADQSAATFVQVHDQTGRPAGFAMHRAASGRTFDVNLPNGSYYADVHAGRGPNQRYGRVDFTVAGGPVSGLTVVPLPAAPLTVEIQRDFTADTSQQSTPAIGNLGPINDAGAGVNLSLAPADGSMEGSYGGSLRPAPGSAYGNLYQWQITAQGRFWLRADALGPYYVSSITSGGVDLARQPLVIGPGGTTDPIEITLRNDMGKLACTLALPPASPSAANSASEINPVRAYIVPLSPTVRGINQVMVEPSGQPGYQIPLAPGDYLVVASSTQQEIDLDDPTEMARLTAQGQKVTIQPGQTTTVQIDKVIGDTPEAASSEASQ